MVERVSDDELFSLLLDHLRMSLRETVQEEWSVIRHDVRRILREELRTAGDSVSAAKPKSLSDPDSPSPRSSWRCGALPGPWPRTSMQLREAAQTAPRPAPPALIDALPAPLASVPQTPSRALQTEPQSPVRYLPEPPTDLPNALPVDDYDDTSKAVVLPSTNAKKMVHSPSKACIDSHAGEAGDDGQWRTSLVSSHGSGDVVLPAFPSVSPTDATDATGAGYRGSIGDADLKEARAKWQQGMEIRRQTLKDHSFRSRNSWFGRLRALVVENPHFDTGFGFLVVVNSGVLGIQVDWMARNESSSPPIVFRIFEIMFCLAFTCEWVMRLLAYNRHFFSKDVWHWHSFDTFLVGTQLFEEVALAVSNGVESIAPGVESEQNGNYSWLRVMRFMRLVRVMRTVRVLRLVGELRTLVLSILGSLRALVWAVALLLLLMYVIGIFLTQLVLDHRLAEPEPPSEADAGIEANLLYFYGSLGDTILSIYKAVTGGVDWGDILEPLKTKISVYMVPFFMLYIAFAMLCMLNVITGVFVESALASTKQDTNLYLLQRLRKMFAESDLDGDGRISSMEFFLAADEPEIQALFSQLDLPLKEVEVVFSALDNTGDGNLTVEEFVLGCQELAGPSKTLDAVILKTEAAKVRQTTQDLSTKLSKEIQNVCGKVDILTQAVAQFRDDDDGSSGGRRALSSTKVMPVGMKVQQAATVDSFEQEV